MTTEVETPPLPGIDAALAGRLSGSAEVLAGLLAAAALDEAGRPGRLPQFLFPDLPAGRVREVWDAALAVGFRAGRASGRSRWDAGELEAARAALAGAGWEAMAGLVAEPAAVARRAARVEPVGVPTSEPWP